MTLIERLLVQANKEANELADLLNEAAEALAQPQQEPVAEVQVKMTGGNAGISTMIREIYDPLRERLQPGTKLYTSPPAHKPLCDAPNE